MNALERDDDLGALFLGLAIAFACGCIHAFGPGHGKFVIISYFLGRESRVICGVVVSAQVAVVHVIAAVVFAWLADAVRKAGFGIGLSDVPGLRAASFLIIVGIGSYMLCSAIRTSLDPGAGSHAHGHHHAHDHRHGHHYGHGAQAEGDCWHSLQAWHPAQVPC